MVTNCEKLCVTKFFTLLFLKKKKFTLFCEINILKPKKERKESKVKVKVKVKVKGRMKTFTFIPLFAFALFCVKETPPIRKS